MRLAARLMRRERRAVISMGNYALIKRGVSRYDWADPYRLAISLSWPQFLLALLCIYLTVTALFAVAYMLVPLSVGNARSTSFLDHFFFSLETLATVGYGELYPATVFGHAVASMEMLVGVVFTAILTGLIFVRFSKPRPKFIFADHPVVTTHNGQLTLMMRIGNGQASALADAHCKFSVLIVEISKEGSSFRRIHELKLQRATIPVFPLSWTIMHDVDEHSPLHGLDAASFAASDVRLFVSFYARDPELSQVIHDLRSYSPVDVLFGMRYVDIIANDEQGRPSIDIDRISEVEADTC